MASELVEGFVAAFEEELERRRRDVTAERTIRQRQLADVKRKLDGLIEALYEGLRTPGLRQRLEELEDSKATPALPYVANAPTLALLAEAGQ
jgi:site-specific DNA recombinase